MSRPDSPVVADRAAGLTAAYVHIPFCTQRCPYCDFAVVEGTDEADPYFAALETEIRHSSGGSLLDAVFFGGGTPSLAGARRLGRVMATLGEVFELAEGCEVSLEANPEDWTPELATGLIAAGFNRVSFGAQSWDADVLTNLGRRHRPGQIAVAVETARIAGFRSVSVDLIFGEPAETAESWAHTLRAAVGSGVDHVSTYALTVEPGTELFRAVRDGAPEPDEDVQADRYDAALEILGDADFIRYEVSNHAHPGHACVYNLIVWARGDYAGFGLGAHAFLQGRRSRNARVLPEYLDRVVATGSGVAGVEELIQAEADLERMFVGLRRVAGVPLDAAARAFLEAEEGRRLEVAGVIGVDEGRLRVLKPLLTDAVARALLG